MGWLDEALKFGQKVAEVSIPSIGVWTKMLNSPEIKSAGRECLQAVRKIAEKELERAQQRAIEHQRIIHEIFSGPRRILNELMPDVTERLRKDPNPKVWLITNSEHSIFGDDPPVFEEITSSSLSLLDDGFFDICVHGKNFDGSKEDAFTSMVKPTYSGIRNINDPNIPPVLMLAYDSKMLDESDTLIRTALESLLPPPIGELGGIEVATVGWRELESRAKIAGEYLANLLNAANIRGIRLMSSHSLGSFATASFLRKRLEVGEKQGPFYWMSFAGAVPFDAFAEGPFKALLKSVKGEFKNYFSPSDRVLSLSLIHI